MEPTRKWTCVWLVSCLLLLSVISTVDASPGNGTTQKPKNNNTSASDDATSQIDDDDDDVVALRDTNDPASSLSDQYPNPEPGYSTTSTTLSPKGSYASFDSVSQSTVVLVLEVEPKMNSPSKDVEFTKQVFTDYHTCMCQIDTKSCEIILAGKAAQNIQQTRSADITQHPERYTRNYRCRKENSTEIICGRMTTTDVSQCGYDLSSCGLKFTMNGAGCAQGSIQVLWDTNQSMNIDRVSPSLLSMFTCTTQCDIEDGDDNGDNTNGNGNGGTTTTTNNNNIGNGDSDKDDNDDDDDSINPAVIGAIVACAVILIIFVTVFAFWVYRKKRQAKQTATNSSSGMTSSFDGVEHGRVGEFQKKRSHVDLRAHGKSNSYGPTAQANSRSSGTTAHSNGRSSGYVNTPNSSSVNGTASRDSTNNGRISRGKSNTSTMRSDHEPPAYASIEEMSNGTRNEYSSLDDANKYAHPYKALQPPIQDPRLRPPMPLPAQSTNQPLHYYSVAQSPGEEPANQNNDAVSAQYIELVDENVPSAPPIDNEPPSVPATAPPLRESDSSGSQRNATPNDAGFSEQNNNENPYQRNKYFELERENSTDESVAYQGPSNTNSKNINTII